MSSKSFENYTRIAELTEAGYTEVAGRYAFQAVAERRIIPDVAAKLALDSQDTLLEIGCGPGNLLLPLSFMVAEASGIDNSAAIKRLQERSGLSKQIEGIVGDFLTMELSTKRYTKVLIYSVIQYMAGLEEAKTFVARALQLLSPGGYMLLGDLPNSDKKLRWIKSSAGQQSYAEWQALVSEAGVHPLSSQPDDDRLVTIDDEFVHSLMRLARNSGFESFVLPQPSVLPFGNTREDILFVAPR